MQRVIDGISKCFVFRFKFFIFTVFPYVLLERERRVTWRIIFFSPCVPIVMIIAEAHSLLLFATFLRGRWNTTQPPSKKKKMFTSKQNVIAFVFVVVVFFLFFLFLCRHRRLRFVGFLFHFSFIFETLGTISSKRFSHNGMSLPWMRGVGCFTQFGREQFLCSYLFEKNSPWHASVGAMSWFRLSSTSKVDETSLMPLPTSYCRMLRARILCAPDSFFSLAYLALVHHHCKRDAFIFTNIVDYERKS